MTFKRHALKAKLLSSVKSGLRSPLVSIRRKFIVAIPTAHDREKGVNAIVVEAFTPKGKGGDTVGNATSPREMLSSSSRYPFCAAGTWPMTVPLTTTLHFTLPHSLQFLGIFLHPSA